MSTPPETPFLEGEFRRRDHSVQPRLLWPEYKSTLNRAPTQPLIPLSPTLSEITGPTFSPQDIALIDRDLLQNARIDRDPLGERTLLTGRVIDQDGTPLCATRIEIWQANAAGRYQHASDNYRAPLHPNFSGYGCCHTDESGNYEFLTIRPGPYPFANGTNTWRPSHVHFSIFGPAFTTRLVTQMYFEGDPLIRDCPMLSSIPDRSAQSRLVAAFDRERSRPFDCLAYRFDLVLRGPKQTHFENQPDGL